MHARLDYSLANSKFTVSRISLTDLNSWGIQPPKQKTQRNKHDLLSSILMCNSEYCSGSRSPSLQCPCFPVQAFQAHQKKKKDSPALDFRSGWSTRISTKVCALCCHTPWETEINEYFKSYFKLTNEFSLSPNILRPTMECSKTIIFPQERQKKWWRRTTEILSLQRMSESTLLECIWAFNLIPCLNYPKWLHTKILVNTESGWKQ